MGQILGQQFVVENKAGRGLEPRRRVCRPRAEGRLHAVPAGLGQHRQRGDQSQAAVRHHQGFRADRAGQHGGGDPGGASVARRQQREGADRAGEVQAGRAELRVDRRRQRAAFFRRAVHAAAPAPSSCTCPIQGSPQAATDLLAGRVQIMFSPATAVISLVKAGKLKVLASAGSQAPRHPARRADDDRIRHAGFRHGDLVRPDGAGRHAARDRSTSWRARCARR